MSWRYITICVCEKLLFRFGKKCHYEFINTCTYTEHDFTFMLAFNNFVSRTRYVLFLSSKYAVLRELKRVLKALPGNGVLCLDFAEKFYQCR